MFAYYSTIFEIFNKNLIIVNLLNKKEEAKFSWLKFLFLHLLKVTEFVFKTRSNLEDIIENFFKLIFKKILRNDMNEKKSNLDIWVKPYFTPKV